MAFEISMPLRWPDHLTRTPRGRQTNLHGFSPSLTIEQALQFLDEEVMRLRPLRVEVSSHIEFLTSPRLRKLEGVSPAIAVHFRLENGRYQIACDRWLMPQHNIYAIVMTLRTVVQLDEWGVIGRQTIMDHFREGAGSAKSTLHAPDAVEPWRTALGLGTSATLSDANAVYRARAKHLGERDMEALSALNDAIDQARQSLSAE